MQDDLIVVFSADTLSVCVCVYMNMCAFTGGIGSGKAESLAKVALPHMTSVESDSSDRQVNHYSQTWHHDIPFPDTCILKLNNNVY